MTYGREKIIMIIDDMEFEWDPNKDLINRRKHGVSFEEAASAFTDAYAVTLPDPKHSQDEDRFIVIGLSSKLRLLVVSHCSRKSDTVVRIISARKAKPADYETYNEYNGR